MREPVTLKSQFAVTTEEVARDRQMFSSYLVDAMRKVMDETDIATLISKKWTSYGIGWEFGTILRTRAVPSHKIMVIRDDGQDWAAILLTGTAESPTGTLLEGMTRSNWEPDTP